MSCVDCLAWLRVHNGGLRFESDGTVSAWVNGCRRRRRTLRDAVEALRKDLR